MITSSSFAMDALVINNPGSYYKLGTKLETFEDKSRTLTIYDIMKPDISNKFIRSKKQVPNFSYTKSAYWVKFKIKNNLPDQKDWLLIVVKTQTDKINLYIPEKNGVITVKRAGRLYEFKERDVQHQNFIFKLRIEPGTERTFYMRFESIEGMSIPIQLWSPEQFTARDHKEQIAHGIYYGWVLVMIIYNMFLFFALRDKNYLYYVMFISSSLLFIATKNGITYEYTVPLWNSRIFLFSLASTVFFIYLFSRNFLVTKKYLPRFDKIIVFLTTLSGLIAVLSIFANYRLMSKLVLMMIVLAPIFIPVGIICWKKGYRPARYFLLAWAALITAAVGNVGLLLNILPRTFISQYGVQIGSALEIVLLSLALADRINDLREEKEKAAQELQKAHTKLAQHASILEQKVKARTLQLEMKNEILLEQKSELETANEQIKKQEAMLIQQGNLAILKDITASITHEINTPLLTISLISGNLKNYLPTLYDAAKIKDDQAYNNTYELYEEDSTMLQDALNQIRQQLLNLKSFIKFQDHSDNFNINEEIETTLSILNFKLLTDITIVKDLDQTIPHIKGSAALMNQVLMNLIKNAVDAKKDKTSGIIKIKTYEKENNIIIEIIDNGIGINYSDLARLFKNNFTTKKNGLGIGLRLSHEIIRKLGGIIEAENNPDSGTTFRILLNKQSSYQNSV